MKRLAFVITPLVVAVSLLAAPAQAATADTMSCGGYLPPSVPNDPANQAPVLTADTLSMRQGDVMTTAPLSNDVDPEGATLTIIGLSCPAANFAYVESNVVGYTAIMPGTDILQVAVTDGQHYVTSSLTVTVGEVLPVKAMKIRKNSKTAIVKLSNPNDFTVKVWAGSMNEPKPDVKLSIDAGQSVRVKTRQAQLDVLTLVRNNIGQLAPIGVDSIVIRRGDVPYMRAGTSGRWVS